MSPAGCPVVVQHHGGRQGTPYVELPIVRHFWTASAVAPFCAGEVGVAPKKPDSAWKPSCSSVWRTAGGRARLPGFTNTTRFATPQPIGMRPLRSPSGWLFAS